MPIHELTPEALHARLLQPEESHPVLLDVRTWGEHQIVALPGAVLIPLHELADRIDELESLREREIVVYCHHGVRSLGGAAILEANGFRAVSLRGGIDLYALSVDRSLPRY